MSNDNKELKRSSESLYKDIDACISDIIKARLKKDNEAEGRALFMMETLMVATLQQLSCIIDHLGEEKKKSVDLIAELKHHLETTPKEQLEKEWKELEPWGNVGPTVKEFLYGKQVAEESDAESDYGIDEDYIPATLFHALKKHGWYACHCKEEPRIIDARRTYVMRNWNVGKENLPQDHKPIEDNEDERIRKFIIECIDELRKADAENAEFNSECGEAIAYLEKQKELTPEEKMKHPLYVEGFEAGKQIGAQCESVFGKQKEQKPEEWSEEDDMLIDELESYILYDDEFNDDEKSWRIKKLKSLRPQPSWKPSEEQMKALSWAINYLTDIEQGCASTLALLKFNLKELL